MSGLAAGVSLTGAVPGSDRLTVDALAGDDVVDASALAADTALLTEDGGAGDDVLIGGPGADTLDGGPGNNIILDSAFAAARSATTVGQSWLRTHVRTVDGKAVLQLNGKARTLPSARVAQLTRAL